MSSRFACVTPTPRKLVLVAAALLGAERTTAQDVRADSLIADFERLADGEQRRVLRAIDRKVMVDPLPAIQRVVSLERDRGKLPVWSGRTWHRPDQWAPGVAPPRKLIRSESPEHRAVREKLPEIPFLANLTRGVFYDWAESKVVRRRKPLTIAERLANLAHGYPPGADQALAQIIARLDSHTDQQELSGYLDHLYADVNGKVFEGITLYEAWYSGRTVNVPDVDSIPFARQFLHTHSFRSPIPATRRRTRLFEKIANAALDNRKYRTLIEGAAAGFVAADIELNATYAVVAPRFHYVWATVGGNLDKLELAMQDVEDRDTWIDEVDQLIVTDADKLAQREQWHAELHAMKDRVRTIVAAELTRARRQ